MADKNLPTTWRELLERYGRGERDFVGVELDPGPEWDLRGVCLDGADFSNSWIMADFRGASLRGARFRQANVKTCDFREADLTGADMRGAGLCAARFEGAKIEGADFEGAYVHNYDFKKGETPLM